MRADTALATSVFTVGIWFVSWYELFAKHSTDSMYIVALIGGTITWQIESATYYWLLDTVEWTDSTSRAIMGALIFLICLIATGLLIGWLGSMQGIPRITSGVVAIIATIVIMWRIDVDAFDNRLCVIATPMLPAIAIIILGIADLVWH